VDASERRRSHARAQADKHVLLALRNLDCDRIFATLHPTKWPGFARAAGTKKAAQVGGLVGFAFGYCR
jgi:hypothetical protein